MDLPGRQTAEARSPRPVAPHPGVAFPLPAGPVPCAVGPARASLGDLWFVADAFPVPVLDPVLDPT